MKTSSVRMIVAMAVFAVSGTALLAQPRMVNPEERLNRTMEEVTEAVGLSDEQAEAIRPILQAEMEKQMEVMMAARESGAGFEGTREKMGEVQAETDKQVEPLLSDEQIEKWGKWREERANRRPGPGGRRGGM